MRNMPPPLRGSQHTSSTTRLRCGRHRAAGLREIGRITNEPYGRGTIQHMLLECGHTVLHLNRRDLHVGRFTRCPECE